jgi:hypothetical protein
MRSRHLKAQIGKPGVIVRAAEVLEDIGSG